MKKILMAAVFGLAVAAGSARADFGGSAPTPAPAAPAYGPAYGDPAGGPDAGGAPCDKYGMHPLLRKLCWWKKDTGVGAGGCKDGKCGLGGRGGAGGAGGPPPGYNQGPPGTLVFPTLPFNRGPRDFWMGEPGR